MARVHSAQRGAQSYLWDCFFIHTNKQYEEYLRLCHARDHGQMLMPDGLRLICAGFDYDPEAIEKHMLQMLTKFQAEENRTSALCE